MYLDRSLETNKRQNRCGEKKGRSEVADKDEVSPLS